MQEKNLLPELEKLLKLKRSKSYYSEKLGISIEEVDELLKEIRAKDKEEIEPILEDGLEFILESSKKVNNDKGTLESSVICDYEPKSSDELYDLHKISREHYKISTYWSKLKSNGKFTSSVLASLIREDNPEVFQGNFKDFLSTYVPHSPEIVKKIYPNDLPKISLILPKQDAHFNKFDIGGDNDIEKRFEINRNSILNMTLKASATSQIEEIVYIIGSDQFNSEWTSLTTKGTPQLNMLPHHEAFKAICNHEVDILTRLIKLSQRVKVVFLPGNHDEFVGWHLIDWLESYFRFDTSVEFNSSLDNTKYHRYNNTAIMFNHGDDMKPKDLASKFPIGFKQEWSLCDNFMIITGDKHHEMSLDINGIKFYQVPQLSSAKSKWDDKKGFFCSKAEMTAFVITENNGVSDILKELL